MRHLYVQVYLTLLAVLVLFGVLTGIAWLAFPETERDQRLADGVARLLEPHLAPAPRPAEEQQAALARLASHLPLDLALWSDSGRPLAGWGRPLPPPAPGRTRSHWLRVRGFGLTVAMRLPDGRWLVARHRGPREHGGAFFATLALLALAVAAGAYPLVRRLTRRLERLRARVEELGRGQLSARVAVEGRDEVADLARSFNRAAERVEELVTAQRRLLAGASHELRSPLARLRMALELLAGDQERKHQAARDVAELDSLIAELLDASRLDAIGSLGRAEDVDLTALAAEEAGRVGAEVEGEPVTLRGDARLLRRLVRNLLENARRYGGGKPIEVRVSRAAEIAVISIADRGPGVPEAEQERIFEPFYRPAGTPAAAEGVGLGLALVRQIARAHGGDATCRSRPEGGSMFEVRLSGL